MPTPTSSPPRSLEAARSGPGGPGGAVRRVPRDARDARPAALRGPRVRGGLPGPAAQPPQAEHGEYHRQEEVALAVAGPDRRVGEQAPVGDAERADGEHSGQLGGAGTGREPPAERGGTAEPGGREDV